MTVLAILAAVAVVAGVLLASMLHGTTAPRWPGDERSHP